MDLTSSAIVVAVECVILIVGPILIVILILKTRRMKNALHQQVPVEEEELNIRSPQAQQVQLEVIPPNIADSSPGDHTPNLVLRIPKSPVQVSPRAQRYSVEIDPVNLVLPEQPQQPQVEEHLPNVVEDDLSSPSKRASAPLSIKDFKEATSHQSSPPPLVQESVARPAVSAGDEAAMRSLFQMYDTDGSGMISRKEFHQIFQAMEPLGAAPEKDYDRRMFQAFTEADTNGDGMVNFEEFCAIMLKRVPL